MAAHYRRLDPRLWSDEGFRACSLHEKLIALYTITAQSNRIGLFAFSPGKACDDLDSSPKMFMKGFAKVCETFHWEWDERARVLFIPTWWKYNTPANPNVLKSYLADLHDIPKTHLFSKFYKTLGYLPETFHETFQEGLPKPSPHPSPQRIGDKETEIETEIENETESGERNAHSIGLTFEEIRVRWNAIPGVKPCGKIGSTIQDRIRIRLREHPDSTWWEALVRQVGTSDFLCGRTNGKGGPFHASLDWVLRPTNLDKVLAGDYDSIASDGHASSLTCTKRIQSADGRFLQPCGQSATAQSKPSEPRCTVHLKQAQQLGAAAC
jgi:hypothetical protein